MDPRQPPQHPFSRNTASPYGRTPFPPSSNQASFPPTSHPPSAAPSYSEHQRRPSDPPYYNQQRPFGQEGPPISGPGHSRHQSNSSVGHGTPVNRSMPPPSSPQQQAPPGGHHTYGPPPPRAPPVSVGPPSNFPSRELPRPGGNGGMSISSMLGGPSPAAREPPQPQYASPVATSAPSSAFNSSHASPRLNTSRPDYAPFRRPQTPEHQRQYETRDHRANSAGSPVGPSHYTTPEAPRFSTPQQSYAPRVAVPEERREPIRVPNPNGPPQRPSSQPGYSAPHREADRPPAHGGSVFGRRVDTVPRPADPHSRAEGNYGRPAFEERHNPYGYAEREREREQREREVREQRERERERDILIQREQRERERERENQLALQRLREQRDREAEQESLQREYAHQVAQRNAQAAYSRPPEQREQPAWMRHGYEIPRPAYEPIPEREQRQAPQQPSNGYEYPATTAPQYAPQSVYAPNEPRFRQGPPTSAPQPHSLAAYEAEMQNIQRQAQQRQEPQPAYSAAPQNAPYQAHESPVRREESQPMQQSRSLLGVNEINRRGRLSPLPQAVQGAQGQLNGPGREPSIKNEFSRMFSGIGSGVGSAPSPVGSGPQNFITGPSSGLRREDLETLQELQNLYKPSPAQGAKRRKLKEEERADDESSTGRNTPSGRGKRTRPHNHHHHHHHHHRRNDGDATSSPNLTPFKSAKGANVPSPTQDQDKAPSNMHHHHVPKQHHHHTPTKQPVPTNTIIPVPKITIRSNAVLDSVANLPRRHLGHGYYQSVLRPIGPKIKRNLSSDRGFASTPQPLPRFEGNENCTFTVKIPRIYMKEESRAEITERKAVWGTEVYTDDSDVIAACIHEGWFRGAWPEAVDVSLLGLELKTDANGEPIPPDELNPEEEITSPPEKGPGPVPQGCDCHVKILILPCLEKYGSITRFGLRSREWGFKRDGYKPKHDGLSFKIMSVKFVRGVDGEAGRSGKQRSRIMTKQLDEREVEDEEAWSNFLNNGNGRAKIIHSGFQESFERGTGPLRAGDITGIGMNSWNKPPPKPNGKRKEKVLEKERERAPPTPEPLSDQEMDPLDELVAPHRANPESPVVTITPIPRIVAPPIPEPIPEMEVGKTKQTDQERVIREVTGRMLRNANSRSELSKGVDMAMEMEKPLEVEQDPDTTLDADTTL